MSIRSRDRILLLSTCGACNDCSKYYSLVLLMHRDQARSQQEQNWIVNHCVLLCFLCKRWQKVVSGLYELAGPAIYDVEL